MAVWETAFKAEGTANTKAQMESVPGEFKEGRGDPCGCSRRGGRKDFGFYSEN